MKNVIEQSRRSQPQARTNLKERLGIKQSEHAHIDRSQMPLGDVVYYKSDLMPGMYVCIECRANISLEESFRPSSNGVTDNFSTLFCRSCADKLGRGGILRLEPTRLSAIDRLNMGQFCSEFATPVQNKPAAEASPLDTWKTALGLTKR